MKMIKCGWLSPDCVLHDCLYSNHLPLAHELAEKYGLRREGKQDDDALLYAGWFKITRLFWLGNGGILICWPMPDEKSHVRMRVFIKACITDRHREFFRKAYFDDPSDWEDDTVIEMVDFGIIEKYEVVKKEKN